MLPSYNLFSVVRSQQGAWFLLLVFWTHAWPANEARVRGGVDTSYVFVSRAYIYPQWSGGPG